MPDLRPLGRWPLPLVAAVVCAVAAVAAVIAPADEHRTRVEWPGDGAVPDGAGDELAGAELLIARHVVAELLVAVPCDRDARAASDTLFATARDPVGTGGLRLTTTGGELGIDVGMERIGTVRRWFTGACDALLRVDDDRWQLERDGRVVDAGTTERPVVTGLFAPASVLDRGDGGLRVEVLTEVQSTTPTAIQWMLITIAVIAGGVAAVTGLRHRGVRLRWPPRPRPLDGVVVAVLCWWTVIAPVLPDDGWVMQTAERRYPGGQFRNYHSTWDAWFPLGFVHNSAEWLVSQVSHQFIAHRLLTLVLVIGAWFVLRAGLAVLVPHGRSLIWAGGAAVYLVFALAWLTTLRAEPFVAGTSAVSLAAAVHYLRSRSPAMLLAGGLAVAVGISLHTSGPVVAAPALVVVPVLVHEVRRHGRRRTDVIWPVLVSVGAMVLLVFADSDVRTWLDNQRVFASAGYHNLSWRDEMERYQTLFSGAYDTVVRRASVLTAFAAVVLWFVGLGRRRTLISLLPGAALAISLGILVLTPSKWPWHFGSLSVLAAAALVTELEQMRRSNRDERRLRVWVTGIAFLAIGAIAWRGGDTWGSLVSSTGSAGFRSVASLASHAVTWSVLVGAAVGFGAWLTRRAAAADRVPPAVIVATVAPVVVLAPMLVLTLGRFTTAYGDQPWSLGRQNLDALMGDATCGLARWLEVDVVADAEPASVASVRGRVADPPEVAGLEPLEGTNEAYFPTDSVPAWLGPVTGTYVGGDAAMGWAATAWQTIPAGSHGLFAAVDGRVDRTKNAIVLQRGRVSGSRVIDLSSTPLPLSHDSDVWDIVSLGRYDGPADGVVRLVLIDRDTGHRGWLAASLVSAAPTTTLQAVDEAERSILLDPFLRTYFPCIDTPPFAGGIYEAPEVVVGDSPFTGPGAIERVGDVRTHTRTDGTLRGTDITTIHSLTSRADYVFVPWTSDTT